MKKKYAKIFFILLVLISVIAVSFSLSFASSISESIFSFYAKDEFTPDNFIINIEEGENISITGFNNVTKSIISAPEVASVSIASPEEIFITGLHTGSAFIHIQDSQDLTTIKVNVRYRGFRKARSTAEKIAKKRKGRAIEVGYSYDVSSSSMDYKNRSADWKVRDKKHRFYVSGDTPYGSVDGKLSYYFEKKPSGKTDDIKSWTTDLKNKFLELSAGDIKPSFSSLTMPRTHLQGIQLSSSPENDKFKYDLVAGSTGFYLWGSRLSSFGQIEHRFYGLRAEIFPQKDFSFFATFMNSFRNDTEKTRNVARDLGSIGARYNIGDYFRFEIEGAKNSKKRTAVSSTMRLNIDKLAVNVNYKDIAVDYLNLTGNTPNIGKRGIYTTANFDPLDILSLSGTFNLYQNRANPEPDSTEKGNRDFSFKTKLRSPKTNTDFLLSYYHYDDRGYKFPVVSSGYQGNLVQRLNDVFLLGNIRGDLNYRSSKYKSFLTGISNYTDNTVEGSLSINPVKGLSFIMRETLNFREWNVRDESTSPSRFFAGVGYGTPIGKLPIYANVSLGYQRESNVNQDIISTMIGENRITAGAGIRGNIAPSVNAFLDASVDKIEGTNNSDLDRLYTRINWGVTVDWDSALIWEGYGSVKGYVYRDVNRNGVMDSGDIPMKGVNIMVDRKKRAATNSEGFYRIRYLKTGLQNITLDLKTIPDNYVSTTALSVQVDMDKMEVKEADFGLAPKSIINGMIFNDLNRNDTYEETDEPLGNVLVTLENGKTAFTTSVGNFIIRNVSPGKHRVEIDKNTAPKNLVQKAPFSYTVIAEEGKENSVQFVFYAPRSITGKVYVDDDNNKKFTRGEGLGDVKLIYDDKVVIADKDGSYVFRNLPVGEIKIIVDKNSIPADCKLEEGIITINMKKGKDDRKDFNIKLLRKP